MVKTTTQQLITWQCGNARGPCQQVRYIEELDVKSHTIRVCRALHYFDREQHARIAVTCH